MPILPKAGHLKKLYPNNGVQQNDSSTTRLTYALTYRSQIYVKQFQNIHCYQIANAETIHTMMLNKRQDQKMSAFYFT